MEDINYYIDHAKEMMEKALEHVKAELAKIRAGKASPGMLDSIRVDYYGNPTPLNQIASVNSPDPKTLMIKPWEKTIINDIEKAIRNSDLGLNPQNDGEQVFINLPPLTEERRESLVKQARNEGEEGKISTRNARHDALNHIKALKDEGVSEDEIKRAEDEVQELTNQYGEKIDELVAKKEEDIMHV